MRTCIFILLFSACVAGSLPVKGQSAELFNAWPQWRGPLGNGIAPAGEPPVEWTEKKNIKWKSEIPGTGHATPVIREDQIILLSAIPTERKADPDDSVNQSGENKWMNPTTTEFIHRFSIISVSRRNGSILWQTTVREEQPYSQTHQFGSWASNSPVTDGEHIFAYFGSHGLYCLDMQGNLVWERDLGRMEKVMSFGEGCSPALYEDKLIIVRDHQGPSDIHVLNKLTGETIWKKERDEISAWATPVVIEYNGRVQIITAATNKVRSYDLATGEVIWECTGMTRNVIPTPIVENGIVYLASGFRGSALLAVDLSKANGDISGTDAIVWKYEENTPYTPSMIVDNGKVYFLKANNGFLSCLDAKNGREYYSSQKLEGIKNIFTSPVAVADRIYIVGSDGPQYVIRQGEHFEILSQNSLDDNFIASPVILGDELFLRGNKYLYCISEDPDEQQSGF